MAEVALEEAPRKARNFFEKGFAAMERNNLDYAMDLFTASLDIEPRLLQARRFLRAAQVKKFKTKKKGPIGHVLSSLQGLPTCVRLYSSLKKKPEQALKAAEKLLRLDPLNKFFIKQLDQAAMAAGMPEVAVQTMEMAKEHYPRDLRILQRLGELYMEVNQTQKARECFEQLVEQKPTDPQAIKALKDASALDTLKKGGWAHAASYREVMKDAQEAHVLEQQAKTTQSGKDIGALIQETLAKISREPENIQYKRSLAHLYADAGRFDEALTVLHESQALTGEDPQIDRAISAIRVKKFDKEIKALQKEGDVASVDAKKKEKNAFLLQDAETRVKRYPNDLSFKYDYGVLLYEHGRMNEAIQEFQHAQRNPQRRVRSLYYLGLCFKRKSQYDIAAEEFEKAVSQLHTLDNTKKDILYELGLIYETMGNHEKAIARFKEIYAEDINYKDVAQKVEQDYHP